MVAVAADMSNGATEVMVMSSINTSTVKATPAIGALKMPPIAPAAPQPTSNISVFWSRWKARPKLEPMAEPVSTMGASAPTEPPKPMVMALATTDDHILCTLMMALRCDMAYKIFVTP